MTYVTPMLPWMLVYFNHGLHVVCMWGLYQLNGPMWALLNINYDKLVRHGLGFRGLKICDAWHPKLTLT